MRVNVLQRFSVLVIPLVIFVACLHRYEAELTFVNRSDTRLCFNLSWGKRRVENTAVMSKRMGDPSGVRNVVLAVSQRPLC